MSFRRVGQPGSKGLLLSTHPALSRRPILAEDDLRIADSTSQGHPSLEDEHSHRLRLSQARTYSDSQGQKNSQQFSVETSSGKQNSESLHLKMSSSSLPHSSNSMLELTRTSRETSRDFSQPRNTLLQQHSLWMRDRSRSKSRSQILGSHSLHSQSRSRSHSQSHSRSQSHLRTSTSLLHLERKDATTFHNDKADNLNEQEDDCTLEIDNKGVADPQLDFETSQIIEGAPENLHDFDSFISSQIFDFSKTGDLSQANSSHLTSRSNSPILPQATNKNHETSSPTCELQSITTSQKTDEPTEACHNMNNSIRDSADKKTPPSSQHQPNTRTSSPTITKTVQIPVKTKPIAKHATVKTSKEINSDDTTKDAQNLTKRSKNQKNTPKQSKSLKNTSIGVVDQDIFESESENEMELVSQPLKKPPSQLDQNTQIHRSVSWNENHECETMGANKQSDSKQSTQPPSSSSTQTALQAKNTSSSVITSRIMVRLRSYLAHGVRDADLPWVIKYIEDIESGEGDPNYEPPAEIVQFVNRNVRN